MTLLYLVDYFKKKKNIAESERWFKTAEEYFIELAQLGQGDLLEARAMLYHADLYNRSENYDQSAQILLNIYNKFPKTNPGQQALFKAIRLYQNELGNKNIADSLLGVLKISLAKSSPNEESKDLLEN